MKTKHIVFAIAVVAGLLGMGGPGAAEAQDVQITGPLAGAPACRHCRIYREGRIQLQPFVGFTLQDEFVRTMIVGAQANYHLTDWLGIGVWGGYGLLSLDTALTDEVAEQGQTTETNELSLPSAGGFPDQVGRITFVGAGQLTFIPLRGKLALFQKLFVDTDFYLFAGVAAVGVEERADVGSAEAAGCADGRTGGGDPCLGTQTARASRVAIAPTFGVGLTLYFNDFLGLSIEYRGLPFAWNTSGFDVASESDDFPDGAITSDDRIFHYNHMVNVGFVVYLPTEARISE